jgi:hypothetical protein
LLQPEVVRQLGPQTTYADVALWTVERFYPRYLVLHRGLFPELERSYLPQHCQQVHSLPGDPTSPSSTLDIYTCNNP